MEENDTMSDHRRICFSLKHDKLSPVRVRNKRNTNWSLYEEELRGTVGLWFGKVENPADIERELTFVNKAISQSFEKACPEKKIDRRNRVPWWNRELKLLRRKANRAFHKAYRTRNRNQEDWDLYKEARRAFKTALRRRKRGSWRDFCTKTEKVHESISQAV